ncbi:MAG: hypothetical protein JW902_13495 [Syntrophaceae bacterium]|nr:hypothetical protein [Syntrophaceae bacterium]
MKIGITDTKLGDEFPPPPVKGSDLLVPITTWAHMLQETQVTGVQFDEFWCDSVENDVAYFFRWLGEPRATVLLVWDDEGLMYIECRKSGDMLVSEDESERILSEVIKLFPNTGFWCDHFRH